MADPRLSVLVVDDDPEMLAVISDTLRMTPLIVNVAGSGAAALAFLARERVAVLFTDLNMPGMSGYELVEAIRGQMPASLMKICVISGLINEASHSRLRALGVSRVLEKPFRSRHLLEMALEAAELTMDLSLLHELDD